MGAPGAGFCRGCVVFARGLCGFCAKFGRGKLIWDFLATDRTENTGFRCKIHGFVGVCLWGRWLISPNLLVFPVKCVCPAIRVGRFILAEKKRILMTRKLLILLGRGAQGAGRNFASQNCCSPMQPGLQRKSRRACEARPRNWSGKPGFAAWPRKAPRKK
jgi:hypothetical protein